MALFSIHPYVSESLILGDANFFLFARPYKLHKLIANNLTESQVAIFELKAC